MAQVFDLRTQAELLAGARFYPYLVIRGIHVYRRDTTHEENRRVSLLAYRHDPATVDEEAEGKVGELWLRELAYWEARGWSGRGTPQGEMTLRVVWVEVEGELQRAGIGTALYETAAQVACELELPLSSDLGERRSQYSQGFWLKQERKGRAKNLNPSQAEGAVSVFMIDNPCSVTADAGGLQGVDVDNDLVELYHVTYEGNLESISTEGLDPARAGIFKETGYGGHSEGRLFLTEADGISYWYGTFERHADHHSENLHEEQMVPVVLRVRVREEALVEDEVGTRDALADAFYVTELVQDIELWNGNAWVDPGDGVDPELALDWVVDSEEADPEYEGYWQFKSDNPLSEPDVESGEGLKGLGKTDWVDEHLRESWPELQAQVPAERLPSERPWYLSLNRRRFFSVQEYGCGAYGCVMPTGTPNLVVKLTTDEDEAWFAQAAMQLFETEKSWPGGLVQYYEVMGLQDQEYDGAKLFLLWRDEAWDVGFLEDSDAPLRDALETYDIGSVLVFDVVDSVGDMQKFLRQLDDAVWVEGRRLGRQLWLAAIGVMDDEDLVEVLLKELRELSEPVRVATGISLQKIVADFLSTSSDGAELGVALGYYLQRGISLLDVHGGNVGRTADGVAVITDPGVATPFQLRWLED